MPTQPSPPKSVERAALTALSVAFAGWATVFIRTSSVVGVDGVRRYSLFDDAMISMRYAWNLAHGHGLVWNPGERVEGITNLLMTLYMAAWCSVLDKATAVLAVQISGGVFMLLAAVCSWRAVIEIAGPAAREPWLRILVFAATLSYYPLAFWSLGGMETGLLSALTSAAVLIAIARGGSSRAQIGLSVLLGLAFVTRPDAAVSIALIALYRVSRLPGKRRLLSVVATEWGILAAFVAGTSLFRVLYYGHFTPNTYVLKIVGFPLLDRIANGLGFIAPFIASIDLLVALALAGAVVDGNRGKLLVAALLVAATTYQVWVGGDPWPYWRQMAHVMPLFLGLVVVEISLLCRARFLGSAMERRLGARPRTKSALQVALASTLSLVALGRVNAEFLGEAMFRTPPMAVESAHEQIAVAIALRDIALPGASVGVTSAGTIPYYSDLLAIDFLGKSDSRIAALPPDLSGAVSREGMKTLPGHNKYDLRYSIKGRRPTYIQEFVWGRQDLTQFVSRNYVSVDHMGATLCLAKDSPQIEWRRLSGPRRPGCQSDLATSRAAGGRP
jgi:arabinofuranosyltransferase